MVEKELIAFCKKYARPLTGKKDELNSLLDYIGDARCVLLGEATHGTHEFYALRARITLELITKKGFNAIGLEADWPDAYRINRYIQGQKMDTDTIHALDGFKRFPQWMWRNTAMVEFVSALYHHNRTVKDIKQVGLYGLDLYSLYQSIDEVLSYLDKTDAAAAQRARSRYNCLQLYERNAQQYGYATMFDISASCQQQVLEQLKDIHQNSLELLRKDGQKAVEEYFFAQQNAQLIKDAEHYYRSLFFGSPADSWNIRDTHMMQTAQAIIDHISKKGETPKMVIWAHNSHIGNAKATQLGQLGEINIGQLMKETYKDQAKLIGFTTYSGTVSAATEWDGTVERKQVRPALANSYEAVLHQAEIPNFMLFLQENQELKKAFQQVKLERAIGVIYRPETERTSHYFNAALSSQFDAVIHLDQTKAVEPLEKTPAWISAEFPETYPTGI